LFFRWVFFQVYPSPNSPENNEKTTFTGLFGTYALTRMSFGLCNAPATFQRCMITIFVGFTTKILEVFMGDFNVHGDSFDECLDHLTLVLRRCIETTLVSNFEKCHLVVKHGVVLGHVVSTKGTEVDKANVDIIQCPPYPKTTREDRSF